MQAQLLIRHLGSKVLSAHIQAKASNNEELFAGLVGEVWIVICVIPVRAFYPYEESMTLESTT